MLIGQMIPLGQDNADVMILTDCGSRFRANAHISESRYGAPDSVVSA